jgi:glycosyltransferase involved in cell wall biosynthesis/tetratricopeptide (TPR) repeat protein
MRILLLTPFFLPDKGGAAQAFKYLTDVFSKNQNVSEILILSNWKKGLVSANKKDKVMHFRLLRWDGVEKDSFFHLKWNFNIIRWFIDHYKPHMILFHSVVLPYRQYYPELFKNLPRTAVYLYKSDHFPVPHCQEITGVVYMSKNLRYPLLHQWGFPGKKLVYIPILFKPPAIKEEELSTPLVPFKYILYLGAIYPLKGINQLLQAFTLLEKDYPGLKLLVVGPLPFGYCYNKRVVFLETKKRSQVYNYIKNAEMVVIPSYSEGLPRVALETLYLKKPLLVTKVVEEFKHFPAWQLLEKPNPGEIAEKIKSILRGAAISTQFPWEETDFKKVTGRWNMLVNQIQSAGPGSSTLTYNRIANDIEQFSSFSSICPANSKNPFCQIWNRTMNNNEDYINPGQMTPFLLHLSTANRDDYLSWLMGNPWLMNSEKKELLKQMIDRLFHRFNIHLPPGNIHRLFFSLPPFTSNDYLFIGKVMLRQNALAEAKKYCLLGLEEYPEITRFKIYQILLTNLSGYMNPKEKQTLEHNFSQWLKSIPGADLITILDEAGMDFLSRYMDIEALLPGEPEEPGSSYKKDRDRYFNILYLTGIWRQKHGTEDHRIYFQKALRILKRKRNKTLLEIYRMASLEKQLNHYTRAVKSFKSLTTGPKNGKIVSGAFFHLGEIALEKSEIKDARNYFLKSLEADGSHLKSREYLSKLEAGQ